MKKASSGNGRPTRKSIPVGNTAISSTAREQLLQTKGTSGTTTAKRRQTYSTRDRNGTRNNLKRPRIATTETKTRAATTTTTKAFPERKVTPKWGIGISKMGRRKEVATSTSTRAVTAAAATSKPKISTMTTTFASSTSSDTTSSSEAVYRKRRGVELIDVDDDDDVHRNNDEEEEEDHSSLKDDDMEVPYALNLGHWGSSDDDSDGGYDSPTDQSRRKKRREPLRPGDVIEYTNPIFVSGHIHGLRRAVVLSTDPTRKDFPLVLDNAEVLPRETHIKRIGEFLQGEIHSHPGVFRPLDLFLLTKSVLPGHDGGLLAGLKEKAKKMQELSKRIEADAFEKLRMADEAKAKPKTSNQKPNKKSTKRGRKKRKKQSHGSLSFPSSSSSSLSSSSSSSSDPSMGDPQHVQPTTIRTKSILDVSSSSESNSSPEDTTPSMKGQSDVPLSSIKKKRVIPSSGSESSSTDDGDSIGLGTPCNSTRSVSTKKFDKERPVPKKVQSNAKKLPPSKRGSRPMAVDLSKDSSDDDDDDDDSVANLPTENTKASHGWIHKSVPSKKPRKTLQSRKSGSQENESGKIPHYRGRRHPTTWNESKTTHSVVVSKTIVRTTKDKETSHSGSRQGYQSSDWDKSSDDEKSFGSQSIVQAVQKKNSRDCVTNNTPQKKLSKESLSVSHSASRSAADFLGISECSSSSNSSSSDNESISSRMHKIHHQPNQKTTSPLLGTQTAPCDPNGKGNVRATQVAEVCPVFIDLSKNQSSKHRAGADSRVGEAVATHGSAKTKSTPRDNKTRISGHRPNLGSSGLNPSYGIDDDAGVASFQARRKPHSSSKERLVSEKIVRETRKEKENPSVAQTAARSISLGLRKHNGRETNTPTRPSPAVSTKELLTGDSSKKKKRPAGTGFQPLLLSPVHPPSAAKHAQSRHESSSSTSSKKKTTDKHGDSRRALKQRGRG